MDTITTTFDDIAHLDEISQQIFKHLDLHSILRYITVAKSKKLPFKVTSDASRFKWYLDSASIREDFIYRYENLDDEDNKFVYGYFDDEVEEFAIRFNKDFDTCFILKFEHGLLFYRVSKYKYMEGFSHVMKHVCKTLPAPSVDTLTQKIVNIDYYVKTSIAQDLQRVLIPKIPYYQQFYITKSPIEFEIADLNKLKKEYRPKVYTTRRYGEFETRYTFQGKGTVYIELKDDEHMISICNTSGYLRVSCSDSVVHTSARKKVAIDDSWKLAYSIYYNILYRTPKVYVKDVEKLGDFKKNEVPMHPLELYEISAEQ